MSILKLFYTKRYIWKKLICDKICNTSLEYEIHLQIPSSTYTYQYIVVFQLSTNIKSTDFTRLIAFALTYAAPYVIVATMKWQVKFHIWLHMKKYPYLHTPMWWCNLNVVILYLHTHDFEHSNGFLNICYTRCK